MGRKANQDALRWVEKALSLQMSHHDIVAKGAPKWAASSRTVYRWIALVYERMEIQATRERPMRRQQMVGSLRMIMQKAVELNKLHDAIDALDRIARLQGLYQDQVAVTHHAGDGVNLPAFGFKSRDEVRARVAELKARLLNGGGPISAGYIPASCVETPSKGNGSAGSSGAAN